jgi:hypothetical protein
MKSSKVHQHATIFLFLCLRMDAFSCQTQQLGRRATIGAFPTLAFARIERWIPWLWLARGCVATARRSVRRVALLLDMQESMEGAIESP